jgi:hypothetical protein
MLCDCSRLAGSIPGSGVPRGVEWRGVPGSRRSLLNPESNTDFCHLTQTPISTPPVVVQLVLDMT